MTSCPVSQIRMTSGRFQGQCFLLWTRIRRDQLGKVQPDTRNPVLALALEVMGITENRYSGIPTIKRAMEEYGLREPEFSDQRGSFVVRFYREPERKILLPDRQSEDVRNLLVFCRTPRTRKEICQYLGLTSVSYAISRHVMPLVEQGLLCMSMPERPKSQRQLFYTNQDGGGRRATYES